MMTSFITSFFYLWTVISTPFQCVADPSFSWIVSLKEFAHPVVETYSSVGTAGPSFFLAIAMFGFVLQISSLIVEKELRLRQVLRIFFFF